MATKVRFEFSVPVCRSCMIAAHGVVSPTQAHWQDWHAAAQVVTLDSVTERPKVGGTCVACQDGYATHTITGVRLQSV